MLTINFVECGKDEIGREEKAYRDERNGIYCYRLGTDYLQTYINYIELLYLHRKEWKGTGYLDLGMMPLVMAPSFMQELLTDILCRFANQLNIPVYSLPPVSMFFEKCKIPVNDVWVYKKDVARVMQLEEDETVSFTKFMRWCLDVYNRA